MYVLELDRAALQQAITVLRHELAFATEPDQRQQIERDLRGLLKQWMALAAPQGHPPVSRTQRYRRCQPLPYSLVN